MQQQQSKKKFLLYFNFGRYIISLLFLIDISLFDVFLDPLDLDLDLDPGLAVSWSLKDSHPGNCWYFFSHTRQYLFGSLWIYNHWNFSSPLSLFHISSPMNPSTPPTSPQQAQAAARQAERNQRNIGSPPARRHPAPMAQPLQNAPQMNIPQILGNLNYGPIPMQRFPGLPRNVIEHHEAQRMWRQHHPPPQPGPPVPAPPLGPPFGQPGPAPPLGPPFGQPGPAPPLGPPFGYIPPPAALQNDHKQ
ncbi:hypothetical protein BD769DRAFT_1387355 [Suillus cothurnatus]|nr:hypothetical protein BD769DRAFT_1387355 [Suillus cothurnatus]